MRLNSSNQLFVKTVNRLTICSLKPQYYKEQWSSLVKFPLCARITFQWCNFAVLSKNGNFLSSIGTTIHVTYHDVQHYTHTQAVNLNPYWSTELQHSIGIHIQGERHRKKATSVVNRMRIQSVSDDFCVGNSEWIWIFEAPPCRATESHIGPIKSKIDTSP